MKVFCAALLTLFFIAPGSTAETAYELDCPDVTIIVSRPGAPTLRLAHELAACLGAKSEICTLQVIKLTRHVK